MANVATPVKSLGDLPTTVLEYILSHLKYDEILKLRVVSRNFYEACVGVLRNGFYALEPILHREMEGLEKILNILAPNIRTVKYDESKKYIRLSLKHAVFRVLHSELRIIRAFCERYTRSNCWNFVSGRSGVVLDEFYRILRTLQPVDNESIIEPEITSELFNLNDKFLEHFEEKVEPDLYTLLEEEIPFGLKCIDVLDCAKNANFKAHMTYVTESGAFILKGTYQLRDISCIDFPFHIYADIPTEKKLRCLLTSLRNNVRWSNFCYPLKELWAFEDAIEKQGSQGLAHTIQQYQHYHLESEGASKYCYVTHAKNKWLKEKNTYYRNEFYVDNNTVIDKCGLRCHIEIKSRVMDSLPLDLEFINRYSSYSEVKFYDCTDESSSEESESNYGRYNFDMNLKVRYPSLDNFDIKQTVIIVTSANRDYTLRLEECTDNEIFQLDVTSAF